MDRYQVSQLPLTNGAWPVCDTIEHQLVAQRWNRDLAERLAHDLNKMPKSYRVNVLRYEKENL